MEQATISGYSRKPIALAQISSTKIYLIVLIVVLDGLASVPQHRLGDQRGADGVTCTKERKKSKRRKKGRVRQRIYKERREHAQTITTLANNAMQKSTNPFYSHESHSYNHTQHSLTNIVVLLLGESDARSVLILVLCFLSLLLLGQGLAEVVEERRLGRGGDHGLHLCGKAGKKEG